LELREMISDLLGGSLSNNEQHPRFHFWFRPRV